MTKQIIRVFSLDYLLYLYHNNKIEYVSFFLENKALYDSYIQNLINENIYGNTLRAYLNLICFLPQKILIDKGIKVNLYSLDVKMKFLKGFLNGYARVWIELLISLLGISELLLYKEHNIDKETQVLYRYYAEESIALRDLIDQVIRKDSRSLRLLKNHNYAFYKCEYLICEERMHNHGFLGNEKPLGKRGSYEKMIEIYNFFENLPYPDSRKKRVFFDDKDFLDFLFHMVYNHYEKDQDLYDYFLNYLKKRKKTAEFVKKSPNTITPYLEDGYLKKTGRRGVILLEPYDPYK